ncbi:hypothetical protein WJX72_007722 [[Myrmecia] bisecta]|uniref:Uncharacterized protein n=1 Tax=[Myrmecia] bisecta TaxID=41462 RepID=A0AAW1Q7P7_9CHLO
MARDKRPSARVHVPVKTSHQARKIAALTDTSILAPTHCLSHAGKSTSTWFGGKGQAQFHAAKQGAPLLFSEAFMAEVTGSGPRADQSEEEFRQRPISSAQPRKRPCVRPQSSPTHLTAAGKATSFRKVPPPVWRKHLDESPSQAPVGVKMTLLGFDGPYNAIGQGIREDLPSAHVALQMAASLAAEDQRRQAALRFAAGQRENALTGARAAGGMLWGGHRPASASAAFRTTDRSQASKSGWEPNRVESIGPGHYNVRLDLQYKRTPTPVFQHSRADELQAGSAQLGQPGFAVRNAWNDDAAPHGVTWLQQQAARPQSAPPGALNAGPHSMFAKSQAADPQPDLSQPRHSHTGRTARAARASRMSSTGTDGDGSTSEVAGAGPVDDRLGGPLYVHPRRCQTPPGTSSFKAEPRTDEHWRPRSAAGPMGPGWYAAEDGLTRPRSPSTSLFDLQLARQPIYNNNMVEQMGHLAPGSHFKQIPCTLTGRHVDAGHKQELQHQGLEFVRQTLRPGSAPPLSGPQYPRLSAGPPHLRATLQTSGYSGPGREHMRPASASPGWSDAQDAVFQEKYAHVFPGSGMHGSYQAFPGCSITSSPFGRRTLTRSHRPRPSTAGFAGGYPRLSALNAAEQVKGASFSQLGRTEALRGLRIMSSRNPGIQLPKGEANNYADADYNPNINAQGHRPRSPMVKLPLNRIGQAQRRTFSPAVLDLMQQSADTYTWLHSFREQVMDDQKAMLKLRKTGAAVAAGLKSCKPIDE